MALADEAAQTVSIAWSPWTARRAVSGRGRHSRAAPLVSATSLAGGLDMAVKNATQLLCLLRRRHRHRGHPPLETAPVGADRSRAIARRGAPTVPNRDVAAAVRPTARSLAVRLQRPRPLDGPDGADHPPRAAHPWYPDCLWQRAVRARPVTPCPTGGGRDEDDPPSPPPGNTDRAQRARGHACGVRLQPASDNSTASMCV